MAKLIGLLHDFGKGTADCQNHLRGVGTKHPNHAGLGALYAYRRWGGTAKTSIETQTAHLISLCVYGHHAGLPDCLTISGNSPYLDGLKEQSDAYYNEAKANFYAEIASPEELDQLFQQACEEIDRFGLGKAFKWGLLARLLLSILVDADRWDSACFEYDADPFELSRKELPDWGTLLKKLEKYLKGFPKEGELAATRRDVSDWCRAAGGLGAGIFNLTVPTGGGKTLSSLRFALAQAYKNKQRRIFYVIPMNTILDQNAQDIKTALDNYASILEHHSNVVLEDEGDENAYLKLTERWDSDIILTSLVHFLDALFQHGNSKARRMHNLTNSVLIFDEIQALPKNCRVLFEKAIRFLAEDCNCTILLCTATQPQLGLGAKEIVPDVGALYQKLKRVNYVPELKPRTYQEASNDITEFLQNEKSVLTVVNTKEAACHVFRGVFEQLKTRGWNLVDVQQGLSEEMVRKRAQTCLKNEALCVHLSTYMCPAHRMEILRWVKMWLENGKTVCCVSTALIEAGINVSFPIVIRSLAGIPSIIQAGGRCNRNCEEDVGYTYIWNFAEERLGRLPDIQKGREISMSLLSRMENPDEIGTPEMTEKYFAREEAYTREVEKYPYPDWNTDLVTMLSTNKVCRSEAGNLKENPLRYLSLLQSFRTAGMAFRVIDQNTKSVLVPYGKGKKLIEKLTGRHTLREELALLKEAQQYSVNLYEYAFEELAKKGALVSVGETGVVVLKDEYYDALAGVIIIPQEMEELIY